MVGISTVLLKFYKFPPLPEITSRKPLLTKTDQHKDEDPTHVMNTYIVHTQL